MSADIPQTYGHWSVAVLTVTVRPTPPHPFILKNCVKHFNSNYQRKGLLLSIETDVLREILPGVFPQTSGHYYLSLTLAKIERSKIGFDSEFNNFQE